VLVSDRLVYRPTLCENPALAVIEYGERLAERLVPVFRLLAFGQPAFLAGAVVDQPIHPFTRVAVLADRRVDRSIAAEPAAHGDDVRRCDARTRDDELDFI